MPDPKTVSDFLIECLALESTLECDKVLLVRLHKDGCISYDTNTNSRMDAYNLASLCSAWTQADIIKSAVREED